ncbi:MAG: cytochrome P450 [Spongiibacteraceae bacterium]
MATSRETLLKEDPMYDELFSVEKEAERRHGSTLSEDIYPKLAELRAKNKVVKGSLFDLVGKGFTKSSFTVERQHYATLDYETTNRVVTDGETFSTRSYDEYFSAVQIGRTILNMGGNEHRRYRGVAQPLFTIIHARNWWTPKWIEEIVDVLISDFEREGSVDLNAQLCARMPMHTITRGLGLDDDEGLVFRFNLIKALSSTSESQEQKAAAAIVHETLLRAINSRRAEPRDDVITALVTGSFKDHDGSVYRLSDDEIINYCRIMMAAGGGTTWRQLGITLYALLTQPENWAAMKADRKLVDAAIKEGARWNATDPIFYRLCETDTQLGGLDIPAGSMVEVCYGAANRDPARWENPDEFIIDRPYQRSLAFGGGVHSCLGMFVGQAEMHAALNALADRCPKLRLDTSVPAPVITGGLDARGVSHMRVRFD